MEHFICIFLTCTRYYFIIYGVQIIHLELLAMELGLQLNFRINAFFEYQEYHYEVHCNNLRFFKPREE